MRGGVSASLAAAHYRHGGKRFAPPLRPDAKDDEEHGQNEKDDGATKS